MDTIRGIEPQSVGIVKEKYSRKWEKTKEHVKFHLECGPRGILQN